ncbi:MAG TPA: FlgD immunoglobulin-like domain containing protein, partial [Bacteroidota bacterium]
NVEGVQTEVKGMLRNLALLLPPIGVDEVAVDTTYTVAQLQSAYNYFFVLNDGSYGVHNTKYAVGLLNYSIGTLTGVEPLGETIPVEYSLEQNYPNPFNPSTEIRFSLPTGGSVKLDIYAITGQKIRTLIDGRYAAGSYKATWDGTNDAGSHVASGIYMYRIEAKGEPSGGFSLARKMVLVK